MARINGQPNKVSSYNKDFSGKYDQISTSKDNVDLKAKYMKLADNDNIYAGMTELFGENPSDPADPSLVNVVNKMANVHMGAIVNANEPVENLAEKALLQSDFNRSVSRALKSLIEHLGKKGLL